MLFLEELHSAIYLLSNKYNFNFSEALNKLGVPPLNYEYTYRKTYICDKTQKKMKKLDVVRVIDKDEEDN